MAMDMRKLGARIFVANVLVGITLLLVLVYAGMEQIPGTTFSWFTSYSSSPLPSLAPKKPCPPAVEPPPVVSITHINPQYRMWWAENHRWHDPPLLPRCSMDVCFDWDRCANHSELLIYLYESPSPLNYFQGLKDSPYVTSDPDEACVFLVFVDDNINTSEPFDFNWLPHWNGGRNHVLVSFSDDPNRVVSHDVIGNASLMVTTGLFETTYRSEFDIGIPVPGKVQMPVLQVVMPFERKYFATFKGVRIVEREIGNVRSMEEFRALHNADDGVVVVTSCNHADNSKFLKDHPKEGAQCDKEELVYQKFDETDLLNTTFMLMPVGRQPSSSRFMDALSAGAIPVLIVDNFVKPFESLVQWSRCILQFPSTEISRVIPALKSLSKEDVEERRRYCFFVYNEYLKDDPTLLRSVVRALKMRFMNTFAAFIENVPLFPGR